MAVSATLPHIATWIICAAALFGVIARPCRLPEATWAVLGAASLVMCSLLSLSAAANAVMRGADVYCFLIGMMLLAELARHEGLFDWLAAHAVRRSNGSPARLFGSIYLVGTLVTICLSNDATAVVLTPAVYAAAKKAGTEPLPYLYICAFIANAASFVLPISNPANLVVYGTHLPSLGSWLRQFAVAAVVSIAVTYVVLRMTQRAALRGSLERDIVPPRLSTGGRLAAGGIASTALLLLVASALDWPLGLPTLLAGIATTLAVLGFTRAPLAPIVRHISWSVLPLVAGLFVLVEAIEDSGVLAPLVRLVELGAAAAPGRTAVALGSGVALACNVANNLPVGLLAGSLARAAQLSSGASGALLIGVDLGPNLSVTGSLATILWLVSLRREGVHVSAWRFLGLGTLVMPPALIAALASFLALTPQ